jgi:hypothetical protein
MGHGYTKKRVQLKAITSGIFSVPTEEIITSFVSVSAVQ